MRQYLKILMQYPAYPSYLTFFLKMWEEYNCLLRKSSDDIDNIDGDSDGGSSDIATIN